VDTLGRAFLPVLLRLVLAPAYADGAAASLASMSVYLLMAAVLVWRPTGLMPSEGLGKK
jgi:branched-chain amino acid transport system permease protein